MTARARLSLLVTAVVVLGVAVVLTLSRSSGDRDAVVTGVQAASSPFEGATRGGVPSPALRLKDQDGRETTLDEFRGRPVIVTFMYATCDDTCPAAARQIAGALDELGQDVPTVVISVDPANDTPDLAQRFLNKMRLGGRARYLLGSRAQLAPIWRDYFVEPQGAEFDHSAYVLVLDGQGRQQVAWPVDKLTASGLAHDVRAVQARAGGATTRG
ncbi:SCO family protein [Patulibacter sp. S7RM1-6]